MQEPGRRDQEPDEPVILGSSIRGVLRSVYETATNSCLRTANDQQSLDVVPRAYAPCSGREIQNGNPDLCPACSLFGMVAGGRVGRSYGGRIRVLDAVKSENENENIRYVQWEIPGQYGPRLFMCTNNENGRNVVKGRKFYWHHQPKHANNNRDTIYAIAPKVKFDFEICFDSITEDELKQLVAIIRLDGCGMHKLGAAKPLGFGSVQMDIETITIRKLDPVKNGILYQNCVETDKYKNVTMQEAFGNQDNHLDDLMNILRFEAVSDQNIAYPPTRTGGFNAGNGQRFIRGSIQDVVRQIQDIRTQEQRRREQMEMERAEREAEEQRRMQESASDEDWQRLAARFRRR